VVLSDIQGCPVIRHADNVKITSYSVCTAVPSFLIFPRNRMAESNASRLASEKSNDQYYVQYFASYQSDGIGRTSILTAAARNTIAEI
jgi:hypothetical protein